MFREPNELQVIFVILLAIIGGWTGSYCEVDIGHAGWVGPVFGAIAGAIVGLIVGQILWTIITYWRRGADE